MAGKVVCGGLSALFMSSDDEEFQEEDVWSLIPNTDSSSSKLQKNPSVVCGGLSALFMSSDDEEFQEEDVWSLIPNTDSSSSKLQKNPSVPACRHLTAKPPIPKSAAASSATPVFLQPQPPREATKPMDILKEEPKENQWWDDDGEHDVNPNDVDEEDFTGRKSHRPYGANDDDAEYDNLPPHEMLAKKYKKNRAAYSMCEGAGRTLKGRDLINVRNRILFLTGFMDGNV